MWFEDLIYKIENHGRCSVKGEVLIFFFIYIARLGPHQLILLKNNAKVLDQFGSEKSMILS